MKMTKKLLALVLSLCMVLAMLAGCSSSNGGDATNPPASDNPGTEDTQKPDDANQPSGEGGSVYWLNFKPELDATAQDLAKAYTEKTGVSVKVVTAAGTYSQQLTAEMDKSNPPTLFVIGNQAGVKDWKDYALDLTGTDIANELNTDAYNLYDETGKLVSIGYCYECYGIIVNPDLVEQAGHKMEDIKNFETLKTVVEDIHARAAELGFDAFTSCDMDSSSSWRFTGHMANLEYYYEQEGTAWTECPPTITGKYMDNFKNLYDLCINNSLTDPKALATGGHDAAQGVQRRQGRLHRPGFLGVRRLPGERAQRHHDPLLLRRGGRGEGRPELRHRELLGHQCQGLRGRPEGHHGFHGVAGFRPRGSRQDGGAAGRAAL